MHETGEPNSRQLEEAEEGRQELERGGESDMDDGVVEKWRRV